MITAAEAKTLYDQSGAEVTAFLKHQVEPKVKEAAASGKRVVFVYVDSRPTYKTVSPTPLLSQVMTKLRSLGYIVDWRDSEGAPYVPLGLADDNGDGPKYVNFGMTIAW